MKKLIIAVASVFLSVVTFSFIYAHSEKVEEVNKVNKCSNLLRSIPVK